MRRILYVTGTRADFGLMVSTLERVARHRALSLELVVTGMHLSSEFGATAREVEESGLPVVARIPVDVGDVTGRSMATGIGRLLLELTPLLQDRRPDAVLVLGDRGEMLAGALAALHANIPVVHVHGGERSGTVDEPIRHAIAKLAHYHFAATPNARDRLVRMGEAVDRVFVTGAPGLDRLRELGGTDRGELCSRAGLDPDRPLALLVYHPVVQEWEEAGRQAETLLEAALGLSLQILALMPNSDAGGRLIRETLESYQAHPEVRLERHLPRAAFVSWMRACDVMMGNSSAGIIEAAALGTPVVNVGSRQRLRERGGNVVDCEPTAEDVAKALERALAIGRREWEHAYGDGRAGARIADLLARIPLDRSVLYKVNAY